MQKNKHPSSLSSKEKTNNKNGLIIFHGRIRGNTVYSLGFRSVRKEEECPK